MAIRITERGFSTCRACNSDRLVCILDLGYQPLPAEYGFNANDVLSAGVSGRFVVFSSS